MNWTKLSAMAEILSSVAILVTLVYLAIQTQQSADSIQANTRQAILDADQQFLIKVMDNPEIYTSQYKPALTDDEKVRLGAYLILFVRMREQLVAVPKRGIG